MSKARDAAAAELFSALGDPTRLSLVNDLRASGAQTATVLADGARVTRQAIVKHLRVLQGAGLVTPERRGREVLYALQPRRLDVAREYLDAISRDWDRALEQLRDLVEDEPAPAAKRRRRGRR